MKLTKKQMEELAPLFLEGRSNYPDRSWAILMQPFKDGKVKYGIIKPPYAAKIYKLIEKASKEKP